MYLLQFCLISVWHGANRHALATICGLCSLGISFNERHLWIIWENNHQLEEAIRENELGVCYTTCSADEDYGLEDDGLEFQVSYDLREKRLKYFIDGLYVMYEQFSDFASMAYDIENADFQAYYSIVNNRLYELLDFGQLKIVDGLAEWQPFEVEEY